MSYLGVGILIVNVCYILKSYSRLYLAISIHPGPIMSKPDLAILQKGFHGKFRALVPRSNFS